MKMAGRSREASPCVLGWCERGHMVRVVVAARKEDQEQSSPRRRFLASLLVGHEIGPEEAWDGIWSLCFTTVLLATPGARDWIIRDSCPRLPWAA